MLQKRPAQTFDHSLEGYVFAAVTQQNGETNVCFRQPLKVLFSTVQMPASSSTMYILGSGIPCIGSLQSSSYTNVSKTGQAKYNAVMLTFIKGRGYEKEITGDFPPLSQEKKTHNLKAK